MLFVESLIFSSHGGGKKKVLLTLTHEGLLSRGTRVSGRKSLRVHRCQSDNDSQSFLPLVNKKY